MPRLTPQQASQKWARSMQGIKDAMTQGIDAVTQNPADQAIAQQEVMVANFLQSVNSGRWANNLRKNKLSDWKMQMKEKGIQNAINGAKMGQLKWERAEAEIAPQRDSILAALPPRGTIEQNFDRSREFGMRMHELRRGSA